jgi:hypothetical protein
MLDHAAARGRDGSGVAYKWAEPLDSRPLDLAQRLRIPQTGMWRGIARMEGTAFGDVMDVHGPFRVGTVANGVMGERLVLEGDGQRLLLEPARGRLAGQPLRRQALPT